MSARCANVRHRVRRDPLGDVIGFIAGRNSPLRKMIALTLKKASFRTVGAVCTTATLALAASVLVAPAAHAERPTPAAPGDPVELVYASEAGSGPIRLLRADGGVGQAPVADSGIGVLRAASKDGKRLAGLPSASGDRRVRTINADGTNPAHIVIPGIFGTATAFSPDGSTLYLQGDFADDETQTQSRLLVAPADRDGTAQPLLPPQPVSCDGALSTSTGRYAFARRQQVGAGCGDTQSVMLYNPGTGEVEPAVELDEAGVEVPVMGLPQISPDGTRLVYVRTLPGPESRPEIRVLDLATKRGKTVNVDSAPWFARWSPDGRYLAFGAYQSVKRVDLVTGRINDMGKAYRDVSAIWANRTVTPSVGVRVYGSDAIGTGVATSRFKFDAASTAVGARKADVAVLTRSDEFYDGLAGAGLAGLKNGPMLLTPGGGLPAAVSIELARVLSPGATVYVLGGRDVVSATVDNQVRALGLVPKRLEGAAVADTGVAIANEMSKTPKRVLVATAEEYYDALAAGAAAGSSPDTTVIFSWGATLPPASAAYLRGLDRAKTTVTAVGGPAVSALAAAGIRTDAEANGDDAADTARLIAARSFVEPKAVGLVTLETWQDALTGGALVSGHGPLLLTARAGLPDATTEYLASTAVSVDRVVTVGGPSAVDPEQEKTAVRLTGPYGFHDLVDSPNGDVKVPLG